MSPQFSGPTQQGFGAGCNGELVMQSLCNASKGRLAEGSSQPVQDMLAIASNSSCCACAGGRALLQGGFDQSSFLNDLLQAYLSNNAPQAANLIKQGAQNGAAGATAIAAATATASKLVRPHHTLHACTCGVHLRPVEPQPGI